MASTGRPRGRPRKTDSPSTSAVTTPALSRKSSTRRSAILPPSKNASAPSTVIDDDDSLFDLPLSKMANGKDTSSRHSLSSLTSVNDVDSDYDTPATSATHTPALQSKPSATRRGRQTIVQPTPTVDAVKRAAIVRNSRLSGSAASKRKRIILDDDDEAENNLQEAADAQLALAMQQEEDAAAASMTSQAFDLSIRRTPRKMQKILPKTDFASDFDDDDELDMMPASTSRSSRSSKRVKVELGASGSNSVTFEAKRAKVEILDSDDMSELSELEVDDSVGDSDFDESDVPLTTLTKKNKVKISIERVTKVGTSKSTVSTGYKSTIKDIVPTIKTESSRDTPLSIIDTADESEFSFMYSDSDEGSVEDDEMEDLTSHHFADVPGALAAATASRTISRRRQRITRIPGENRLERRARVERERLEKHHPELHTMWTDLENLPKLGGGKIEQPAHISRELKPFQLEGVAWMREMEETSWGGGLLGDEMGMGKTIQAVTLIMSDFPNPKPTLVLIPPVALMQWQQEIADYTSGQLKTFVFHGTNSKTKNMTIKDLKKYNVILMSYNSLESMYRKQEKGFKRKDGIYKEESVIHKIQFHRVILDEAHNIKQRTSGSAKACFALKADHKWCLSGTPLQNRIGEFFSLVRFLNIQPFSCYFCKQCDCQALNWEMGSDNRCTGCKHSGMQHVSVFNQELLNPIQKYGNKGPGKEAFRKLRILTDRFMLRRIKRDHSSAMELPAKEIYVDRQFFGEEENDFASSIMNNSNRKFETYVAQGVMLNNYANIFGLIMQMRQVADHPDLILKKNGDGGQNVLVCCICDDTAEEAIRSTCKHDFCRECVKNYLRSADSPDCPQCHIPLSIDLEQPEIEQDEQQVKKNSIINRIKMENWTSSSKIEALVHDLYQLRSKNMSSKSIIFSQFTTMLQLVEWRLRRAGISTVMLDGSMTPAQRQASINKFMTDANVECFLVSLKAGGVALNLTEASKVFIVDPWWNPAAEWQSADRCHRIGQARPCSITRLCIEDSVESRMVLLQEKKANMINSTINSDESAMESLTPEDMQFLFRGN